MNIINLSSYNLSVEERLLLSKGLSFCPNSNLDTFESIKDLNLFARKLLLKSMYSKNKDKLDLSTTQQEKDLDVLLSLLDEQDPTDLIDSIDIESKASERIFHVIQFKNLLKRNTPGFFTPSQRKRLQSRKTRSSYYR